MPPAMVGGGSMQRVVPCCCCFKSSLSILGRRLEKELQVWDKHSFYVSAILGCRDIVMVSRMHKDCASWRGIRHTLPSLQLPDK